jgi:hypothetical protein
MDSPARSVSNSRGVLTLRLKIMIAALFFSMTVLFIRYFLTTNKIPPLTDSRNSFCCSSIYRTIELQDGWTGRIIHTELYFNVLDGGTVVLAMFTMNFAHPGFLLREPPVAHGIKMVESREGSPAGEHK